MYKRQVVVCAIAGKYAGHLLLSDTLKADAVEAIGRLDRRGRTRTDHPHAFRRADHSPAARNGVVGLARRPDPAGQSRFISLIATHPPSWHIRFII